MRLSLPEMSEKIYSSLSSTQHPENDPNMSNTMDMLTQTPNKPLPLQVAFRQCLTQQLRGEQGQKVRQMQTGNRGMAALEGGQRPWVSGGHSEEVTLGEGHLNEKRELQLPRSTG